MKRSYLNICTGTMVAIAIVCLSSTPSMAQNGKLAPGALSDKKVQTGYGADKDQIFTGASPDGDGLPWKQPPPEVVAAAKKAPTPHAVDGHPDLTGFWGPAGWGYSVTDGKLSADGKTLYTLAGNRSPAAAKSPQQFEADLAKEQKGRFEGKNMPPYKPELVAKVKYLGEHQNKMDPAFTCAPKGFPRVGPPTEILQTPNTLAFLYDTVNSSEQNAFRVVSTDGREHDPTLNPSFYGDSIGHWEGNTLVIDVSNFVDDTWLSQNGWTHSDALHVVERLTREGDVIDWQINIDDPNVFTKPWSIQRFLVHGIKGGHALEEAPCVDHDQSHMIDDSHH